MKMNRKSTLHDKGGMLQEGLFVSKNGNNIINTLHISHGGESLTNEGTNWT